MAGCPEGTFHLGVGNIEGRLPFEDGTFDLVLVIGALQYLHSPQTCLAEAYRTLKAGGLIIVAQRNAYSLSNLTSWRDLMRSGAHFFLREEFELFPSVRSVLLDSKLGQFFKRYENTALLNSKLALRGHDVWKFKIKKRIYSYLSLRMYLRRTGFAIQKISGAYFAFSESQQYVDVNTRFNRSMKRIARQRSIPFLYTLARTIVFQCRK